MDTTDRPPEAAMSARHVAATVLDIVRTRVELGAAELAEERARIAGQAVAAVLAVLLLEAGVVLGVIALAWWCPPEQRALVLTATAAALVAAGGLAVLRLRAIGRARPPLLHETLEQLRADAAALRS